MKRNEVTITFEGPPGSGKTLLQHLLMKAMEEAGHLVISTSNEMPTEIKAVIFGMDNGTRTEGAY